MTEPIGGRHPRVDAYEKVTGRARYAADVTLPGMLEGGLVRSRVRHGLLREIDVAQALRIPGVVAIMTARDIPGSRCYGVPFEDHPVLAYDRLRFVGDAVAVVVAKSRAAVEQALACVRVEAEELDAALTVDEAMSESAPKIHPNGNLIARYSLNHGNLDEGFQLARYVIEGRYATDWQDHAFIEPPAVVAYVEDGILTLLAPSQNPFSVRSVVARTLGVEPDRVRVLQPPIGGSFGGKNDFVYQLGAQAALAAWVLQRPVRIVLTREECVIAGNKRHPMTIWHRTGVTEEGRICAADVRILANGGAYAATSPYVLWRAVTHACGAYEIANARVRGEVYYTNNMPAASMRGFGSTQAIFAAERHMDRIANHLKMDPVVFRRRNLLREGSTAITGEKLSSSVGLERALDRALELSGYSEQGPDTRPMADAIRGPKRKGFGVALSLHGVSLGADEGRDYAGAVVELARTGHVVCQTGMTEMGTGVLTAFAQIASDCLRVPMSQVEVHRVDTLVSPESNKTVGSRSTFVGGRAVFEAASRLRGLLEETAASWLGVDRQNVELSNGRIYDRCNTRHAPKELSDLVAWASSKGISLRVEYQHELPRLDWDPDTGQGQAYFCYGFGAQVAEVTVDMDTGKVELDRLTEVVDCGRAINPDAVLGQAYGGAVMGAGYAILEDLGLEDGVIGHKNFGDYLVLTSADIGEILVDWVEAPCDQGPYGAKGIAELTAIGMAPAILNAIGNAKGAQIDELPADLERVFLGRGLKKNRGVG